MDRADEESGIVQETGYGLVVLTRIFHDDPGFTLKLTQGGLKRLEVTQGVLHLVWGLNDFPKGTHYGDCAFPLGDVNPHTVYSFIDIHRLRPPLDV